VRMVILGHPKEPGNASPVGRLDGWLPKCENTSSIEKSPAMDAPVAVGRMPVTRTGPRLRGAAVRPGALPRCSRRGGDCT
jgi:hypothetical protein